MKMRKTAFYRWGIMVVLCVTMLGVFDRAQANGRFQIILVSTNATGIRDDNYYANSVALSADGNRVVFGSDANDLTSMSFAPPERAVLYVYDHALGTIRMIDKNVSGTAPANGGWYQWGETGNVVIDLSGSRVVFVSSASDLTPTTDSNGTSDVFLYDFNTDTVTLISKDAAGTSAANGYSSEPSISDDGNRIVFSSKATNLLGGPSSNLTITPMMDNQNVYLYDVPSGALTLISRAWGSGGIGNNGSGGGVISSDGDSVVYSSYATNLTADSDTNWGFDVFRYDIASGITTLITKNVGRTSSANDNSYLIGASADHQRLLIDSSATDLTASGYEGVHLYDAQNDTMTHIIGGPGVAAYISADGRKVVFSTGSPLSPLDTNFRDDVYLYDVQTAGLKLVSLTAEGTALNGGTVHGVTSPISAVGNRIIFQSLEYGNDWEAFYYDVPTDTAFLLSRNVSGTGSGNTGSYGDIISADGNTILIDSQARDLTTDLNSIWTDVFRAQLVPPLNRPSGLTHTAVGHTHVELAWNDNSLDETSFIIQRSVNGLDGWTQVGTTSAGDITFSDASVDCSTYVYYYRVRAHRSGDSTYSEFTLPFKTHTWTCGVFADVPVYGLGWMQPWIEAFYQAGITTGCGLAPTSQPIYCPQQSVTRAEMAVFIVRALHYPKLPHKPTDPDDHFVDVPVAGKEWMKPWIEEFYDLGITTGCWTNPLQFCPDRPVTRAEMAVFLLRAIEGRSYQPPPASHFFTDMPVAGKEWMEKWVDEFYRRGITTGCSLNQSKQLIFCPEREVTRAEMAVFIIRAFESIPNP